MCRIVGIIDKNSENIKSDVLKMRDIMYRGGPDHAGFFFDGNINLVLAHRRLSIIDLSETGNQPMFSDNTDIVIIFNGEIYNYLELNAELAGEGFVFKSTSDTETIIKSYQKWGPECFSRFRGMFALALYDKRKGKVILARDHAGIKPLYYYCDQHSLYFASEIRAFKVVNKWEENPYWKVYFLIFGYLPGDATTLKDVKPLEKGSYLVFDVNTFESKQYFFLQDNFTEEVTDLNEARKLVHNAVSKAIKRHLIADAPLGLFLSGGIDSSLLTLLAKKYKEDIHTLSIIFDDEAYSEKKFQDAIARQVQSKHQSFLLDKKIFVDALPDIMQAMDQPSADGINSYFISKFAKEAGLKAVLSGLGADELFGGYPSFKRIGLLKKLKYMPGFFFDSATLSSKDKYRKINFLKSKTILGDYLFNRGFFTPLDVARQLDMDVQEINSLLNDIAIPEFAKQLSEGNKVSFFETNLYMENQLLKDTDVMSMWHSIEVRVPFLDYDLIKAVQKIDSNLKFNNTQSKFLLIDAFKDILPKEIWQRKKQGFVFPFESWMRENLDKFLPNSFNQELSQKFKMGKLSWSRYWTYLVSQAFQA